MTAEIDILTAARYHQADLLAEAEARRLARSIEMPAAGSHQPTKRRLTLLLRRLTGAPTFA